jgi:hypothetical protein
MVRSAMAGLWTLSPVLLYLAILFPLCFHFFTVQALTLSLTLHVLTSLYLRLGLVVIGGVAFLWLLAKRLGPVAKCCCRWGTYYYGSGFGRCGKNRWRCH